MLIIILISFIFLTLFCSWYAKFSFDVNEKVFNEFLVLYSVGIINGVFIIFFL